MRRLVVALFMGLMAAGCGQTGCGDVLQPLDTPIPQETQFDRAAAVRVSEHGISFVQDNVGLLISQFSSFSCDDFECPFSVGRCDGDNICRPTDATGAIDPTRAILAFEIEENEFDAPIGTATICPADDINEGDCVVYAVVEDLSIAPRPTGELGVDVTMSVTSGDIPVNYGLGCDINIEAENKTVSVDFALNTEPRTRRLLVEPGDVSFDLSQDDVQFCTLLNLVKGLVWGFIEAPITAQLQETVDGFSESMFAESCADGAVCSRPDISTCDTADDANICRFNSDNVAVPMLSGVEGQIDMAGLLGDFAGEASAVDLTAYASQGGAATGGVDVAFRAGVRHLESPCVPPVPAGGAMAPAFVPGAQTPDGQDYGLAVGVSEVLLTRVVQGAFSAGAMCQTISGATVSQLSTGALSLLAPSLAELTGGVSQPMLLDIRPRVLPVMEIGRNLVGPDPDNAGQTTLLEPLLNIVVDDLDLDMYVWHNEAWVRALTLRVDLVIDLSIEVVDGTNIRLVGGDAGEWIREVEVINAGLLAEDPASLEAAIPALISSFLPQLTSSLEQAFEVPALNGFALTVADVAGVQPAGQGSFGATKHHYVGLFADIALGAPTAPRTAAAFETRAHLTGVSMPTAAELRAGVRPEVRVAASAVGLEPQLQRTWVRVDGGTWFPAVRGQDVRVTDARLMFEGPHRIEVAVASAEMPARMDHTPFAIEVVSDFTAPELALTAAAGSVDVWAADAWAAPALMRAEFAVDGGAWTAFDLSAGGTATLPVDTALHHVMVRVTDDAGHTASAAAGSTVLGVVAAAPGAVSVDAPAVRDAQEPRRAAGCSQGVSGGSMLGLLALVWFARRRRR